MKTIIKKATMFLSTFSLAGLLASQANAGVCSVTNLPFSYSDWVCTTLACGGAAAEVCAGVCDSGDCDAPCGVGDKCVSAELFVGTRSVRTIGFLANNTIVCVASDSSADGQAVFDKCDDYAELWTANLFF